jgi:hypothetical protein
VTRSLVPPSTDRSVSQLNGRVTNLERILRREQETTGAPYATIVVAPANSKAPQAKFADFVLPGGDDTNVFDAAWRAAAGGDLLVLDGDVHLTRKPPSSEPTIFRGAGGGSDDTTAGTRIHIMADFTGSFGFNAAAIKDLQFFGGGRHGGSAGFLSAHHYDNVFVGGFDATTRAMHSWSTSSVAATINNVRFYEVAGICIAPNGQATINNVAISHCGEGIRAWAKGPISNVFIYRTALGMRVNNEHQISNVYVEGHSSSAHVGLRMDGFGATVTSCFFDQCDPAIDVVNWSGGVLSDCFFTPNRGKRAIYNSGTSPRFRIDSCYFDCNPGTGHAPIVHLAPAGAGALISLTNCQFRSATNPEVYVGANASNVWVAMNRLDGTAPTHAGFIDDNGTNTTTDPGNFIAGTFA